MHAHVRTAPLAMFSLQQAPGRAHRMRRLRREAKFFTSIMLWCHVVKYSRDGATPNDASTLSMLAQRGPRAYKTNSGKSNTTLTPPLPPPLPTDPPTSLLLFRIRCSRLNSCPSSGGMHPAFSRIKQPPSMFFMRDVQRAWDSLFAMANSAFMDRGLSISKRKTRGLRPPTRHTLRGNPRKRERGHQQALAVPWCSSGISSAHSPSHSVGLSQGFIIFRQRTKILWNPFVAIQRETSAGE